MGRNKSKFKIKTEYYFHCRTETAKARKAYEDFVKDSRKILKYENQLKWDADCHLDEALRQYKDFYVMGDGTHPFYTDPENEENRKSFYNEYCISPRRMKYNELRKQNAEKGLKLKNEIKHCQRLEGKARQDLLDYFDDRTVWFIATVRDVKQQVADCVKEAANLPKDYVHECHDARTWGFYYDFNEAFRAVVGNHTDMNEAGYYDYAVIEAHEQGLLSCKDPFDRANQMWFKAKYEERKTDKGTPYKCCVKYEMCDKPSWAEHVCGWCLS